MAESCFLSKDWCALTDHAKSCRCWWSHNTETRTRVQQRKWETSALGQNNSWIPAPGTGRLCPGILRKKNNKQKNEGLYGCDIYLKPSACWWNENHSRITWKKKTWTHVPGNRHATSPLNFIPIRAFELLPESFMGKENGGYWWLSIMSLKGNWFQKQNFYLKVNL